MPTWLTTAVANQYAADDWLRDLQQQIGQAFLQRGLPTRREERWKYTDVAALTQATYAKPELPEVELLLDRIAKLRLANSISLVLVNGDFSETLSDLSGLPAGVVLCSFQQALQQQAAVLQAHFSVNLDLQRHPFASLNAALVTDGVFLHVPKNTVVTQPIHLLYLNTDTNAFVSCPRNMIIANDNAAVTLLEEHVSLSAAGYFMNVVTDIHADVGANVQYHKIQHDSLTATHMAHLFVNQRQDSTVHLHTLQVGARLGREDVYVNLLARGATTRVNGFYGLLADDQHLDNHVQIEHCSPHGTSEVLYKGILDKKSRAVFNGKIHVHKDAQKTQSLLANHNLLLSPTAEINTKPELEIYADDVKCAHGDTVGQLDADALFFLRSRGIDEPAARQLLTSAFAADVLLSVTEPAIKQRMTDLLHEALRHEKY
jgi:Fe-S cluster assembly protein SufD